LITSDDSLHVHCTCLGRRSLNVYGSRFIFRIKFVETKTVTAVGAINIGLCHTVLKTVKRNSVFNNQVFRTHTKFTEVLYSSYVHGANYYVALWVYMYTAAIIVLFTYVSPFLDN